MNHFSRTLEDTSAERNVTCRSPADKVSEGNKVSISNQTKNYCYDILVKTLAKNLPDVKIKYNGMISLVEEISRQWNTEAVAWLLLIVLMQISQPERNTKYITWREKEHEQN